MGGKWKLSGEAVGVLLQDSNAMPGALQVLGRRNLAGGGRRVRNIDDALVVQIMWDRNKPQTHNPLNRMAMEASGN